MSQVKDQVKELAGRDRSKTPHLVGDLLGPSLLITPRPPATRTNRR